MATEQRQKIKVKNPVVELDGDEVRSRCLYTLPSSGIRKRSPSLRVGVFVPFLRIAGKHGGGCALSPIIPASLSSCMQDLC